MSRQSIFESNFRRAANRITRQPSPQTWVRLEKKLNGGNSHRSIFSINILGIAAIIILFLIAGILIKVYHGNNGMQIIGEIEPTNEMEYLQTFVNQSPPPQTINKKLKYAHLANTELMPVKDHKNHSLLTQWMGKIVENDNQLVPLTVNSISGSWLFPDETPNSWNHVSEFELEQENQVRATLYVNDHNYSFLKIPGDYPIWIRQSVKTESSLMALVFISSDQGMIQIFQEESESFSTYRFNRIIQ